MPARTNLRALVTGGASGIGLATARALERNGAQVAVLDRADAGPDGFVFVSANVTDDSAVRNAVANAISQLGGLDILVNCAGIGAQGGINSNVDEEWHQVLDVNVVGVARVSRAALPALMKSTAASIVNVGSIAATIGIPDRVLYSASKGAVLSMSMAMAADLLAYNIRVNVVNPGTTDTPWVGRLLNASPKPDEERETLESRQPHGRLVSPDEVADAIVYLSSSSAGSTTGTYLAVDGGMQRVRARNRS